MTICIGLVASVLVASGVVLAQGDGNARRGFQRDRLNAPPDGFTFGRTGRGREGKWMVLSDPTAPSGDHVLAQIDNDDTDYRFPVAVADAPELKDLRLEVRCKAVSGKVDQACGIVFRFQGPDDYYLARANALEDNVNLYRVLRGRRSQIEGWNGKVASNTWHTLAIEARGDHLQVFWEGARIIDARDDTFSGAGKVGVWTKADSVTYFTDLAAAPLG